MSLARRLFKASPIYNFNLVNRDRWVAAQAKLVPAGSRILDVGAGSSPYRYLFKQCEYKTQDFGQLPPELLREHQGYGQIDYVSDILKIPVDNNSFDVILCTEVIEHCPEPIKVLVEISRILKPGGKLIISAPLGSGLHQEPYHFYGGYTPHWYRRFLAEAGFKDFTIEPNAGTFSHYGQFSLLFCRLTYPMNLFKNWIARILWIPFWLMLFIPLGICMPVLCYLLDPLDKHRGYTIGYHVTAVKQ